MSVSSTIRNMYCGGRRQEVEQSEVPEVPAQQATQPQPPQPSYDWSKTCPNIMSVFQSLSHLGSFDWWLRYFNSGNVSMRMSADERLVEIMIDNNFVQLAKNTWAELGLTQATIDSAVTYLKPAVEQNAKFYMIQGPQTEAYFFCDGTKAKDEIKRLYSNVCNIPSDQGCPDTCPKLFMNNKDYMDFNVLYTSIRQSARNVTKNINQVLYKERSDGKLFSIFLSDLVIKGLRSALVTSTSSLMPYRGCWIHFAAKPNGQTRIFLDESKANSYVDSQKEPKPPEDRIKCHGGTINRDTGVCECPDSVNLDNCGLNRIVYIYNPKTDTCERNRVSYSRPQCPNNQYYDTSQCKCVPYKDDEPDYETCEEQGLVKDPETGECITYQEFKNKYKQTVYQYRYSGGGGGGGPLLPEPEEEPEEPYGEPLCSPGKAQCPVTGECIPDLMLLLLKPFTLPIEMAQAAGIAPMPLMPGGLPSPIELIQGGPLQPQMLGGDWSPTTTLRITGQLPRVKGDKFEPVTGFIEM